ncbi:protein TIFY 10A-like [Bidens hawaiensis]|uniref:protein TIFY 10A-like n=1 Tax=Bidens hawaiensis TaxID=980011 RepID=UPI00404ADC9E
MLCYIYVYLTSNFIFLFISYMSSSSEIQDPTSFSGQNMPVNSTFTQTCNLFSQYWKQNSTFPDLTLGRRVPPAATMNLFPVVETPRGTAAQKQQDQSRTMTIFYNSQVVVFGDIAPKKVKEIMKLAEQGAAQKASKPAEPIKNIVVSGSGLPIARRNSIARFFEKRKDRISARTPYQAKDVSKQDGNKTWLGLGAQSQ